MSNPKLRFADDIERAIGMFPALLEYAQEVRKGGSLEQAADEAEKRIAKAEAALKSADKELAEKRAAHVADCEEIKSAAESYASAVMAKGDGVLKEAEARAEQILADAEARGLGIVQNAANEEKQISAATVAAKEKLAALNASIASAESALQQLNDNLAVKQASFDSVSAAHADFLKSIGAK